MPGAHYVVYEPPEDGMPYLAVMLADGKAFAVPFDSAEEAKAYNAQAGDPNAQRP